MTWGGRAGIILHRMWDLRHFPLAAVSRTHATCHVTSEMLRVCWNVYTSWAPCEMCSRDPSLPMRKQILEAEKLAQDPTTVAKPGSKPTLSWLQSLAPISALYLHPISPTLLSSSSDSGKMVPYN